MHRSVSCMNLQEPGSSCKKFNTNRSVLNIFSVDCRPVFGLDFLQPLNFQIQNIFESWYITTNYSR
jgi:hypothetical protein